VLQQIRPEGIVAACAEIQPVFAPGAIVMLCEETRNPKGSGAHIWHRRVEDYERLLELLQLVSHGLIDEIATVPGMESPGEVTMFRLLVRSDPDPLPVN
jgi:hypothetical protein